VIARSCSSYDPLVVTRGSERADDLVDPGVSVAERPEKPSLHGLHEGHLAGAQPPGERVPHILEVHVTDAITVVA
jgi:hypothetical protein